MNVPPPPNPLGTVYVHDCPLEPKIPIFLILGGISGVLKNVFLIVENVTKRHSRTLSHRFKRHKWIIYIWRAVNLVFNLFMLAWIIAGSYWIFSLYKTVHSNDFSNCNELLYKFGFSIVISSYILLVLMCCCTCICAGICLRRKKEQEEEDPEEEEEGEGERTGEERDGSEGESRTLGGSEEELDNDSLTRGEEEETVVDDEDDYLNDHRYDHNGVAGSQSIDLSDDIHRSTDALRESERLTTNNHHPFPRMNNNGVPLQQFDSSPYPSRHQVGIMRARSNTDNLNTSNQNFGLASGDDGVANDDGFEMRNLGHANSTNVVSVTSQQVCRRSNRPVSLSHIESSSLDSIPAMRACALIRNRVHHSSHSSGLYVTQCSEGFSVTAV